MLFRSARGVGLGLLFIPITALSLSSLKGQEIGQGAAFTGMMRQLGGSFGIALITTLISRKVITHSSTLMSHLSSTDLNVQEKLKGLTNAFMSKGYTPDVALKMAYKSLQGMVMKQATVLSYMDIFLYLGILFLICLPIVLFVKKRNSTEKLDLSSAH